MKRFASISYPQYFLQDDIPNTSASGAVTAHITGCCSQVLREMPISIGQMVGNNLLDVSLFY